MVVVVIIGILVAIAIPVYNNVQRSAMERADAANVRILKGAAAQMLAENSPLAAPVNWTSTPDATATGWRQFLEAWPQNPLRGNAQSYTVGIAVNGTITIGGNGAAAAGQ